MSIPIVSVCVASYNHARFLPAMLDGLLSQTFRDFEIIIVDDGSTDNSMEVLQGYAERNPDIMRVYTHPGGRNRGISATVNLGFEKSRGKYWCLHDSDDISYSDRLARQVAFLESHPEVGWVYGVADRIDDSGALLDGQIGSDLSSCTDLVERIIWDNPFAGVTALIRRDCALRIGLWDETLLYSDWEYWMRLASQCCPDFIPGSVIQYRVHGSNASWGVPREARRDRSLQVIRAARQKADSTGGLLARPRTKAQLDFRKANLCFEMGDFESGRRELRSMFQSDPTLRFNPKPIAQWLCRAWSWRAHAVSGITRRDRNATTTDSHARRTQPVLAFAAAGPINMKTEQLLNVTKHAIQTENAQNDHFAELFSECPVPPEVLINHLGLFLNRNCLSRALFLDEIYRQIIDVPGVIIEFGVRWGQSLALYSNLRSLYEPYNLSRLIIGFDTFEGFPSISPKDGNAANLKVGTFAVAPNYEVYLEKLLSHYENAAPRSGSTRFRLLKGDACKTLPQYLDDHPETIIALAYFDFDIYEPTKVCLERILPHLTKGSIIAFDELNKPEVPGETIAVRDVLGLGRYRLKRSVYRGFPCYLVVE